MLDFSTRADSMERETGIEPALVAWKATVLPLNYSRPGEFLLQKSSRLPVNVLRRSRIAGWWREVDSNHRRHEPADLQSAPVGRLGIPPNSRNLKSKRLHNSYGGERLRASRPLTTPASVHGAAYFQVVRTTLSRTVLPFRRSGPGSRPDAPRRGNGRSPARCSCRAP